VAESPDPFPEGVRAVVARAVAMREEARLARERNQEILIANEAMRDRLRVRMAAMARRDSRVF
jgi:hypothetical protein